MREWNLLQSFLAVADHGSLTAAADHLGLSQPTLGRHIRRLESDLGEVLFLRKTSGFELTPRATLLYEHAQAMAHGAHAFDGALAGFEERISGTVRIATAEVFSTRVLPSILGFLLDQYPELQLELVVDDREQNLLKREADVAVRHFRSTQQDVTTSRIARLGIGLFAHRDYLARHGAPETPQDLFRHRIIGFDLLDRGIKGARDMGLEVQASDFRIRTDSVPTQSAAVLGGLGIGSFQIWLSKNFPELVRVLPDVEVGELEVWVAAHDDLQRSARIRAVYEGLGTGLREFFDGQQ